MARPSLLVERSGVRSGNAKEPRDGGAKGAKGTHGHVSVAKKGMIEISREPQTTRRDNELNFVEIKRNPSSSVPRPDGAISFSLPIYTEERTA